MLFARYYLWIAPHVLLALLLVRVLHLRLQKQLPFFLAYIVFELLLFVASFTISRFIVRIESPVPVAVYRWVVLVFGNGINTLLELGVIYELANELLFPRSSLTRVLRRILGGILALLLLVAAVSSGAMSDVSVNSVMNIFQVLDFSSSLIRAGMLLMLFALANTLRIQWRSRIVGIAVGFGISACIDLAGAAWRASFGSHVFIAIDITQMAAFNVCVIVWLVYLFLPERSPAFVGAGLEKNDIELWNHEVERMFRR